MVKGWGGPVGCEAGATTEQRVQLSDLKIVFILPLRSSYSKLVQGSTAQGSTARAQGSIRMHAPNHKLRARPAGGRCTVSQANSRGE
jgi:hypothetical protein